MARVRFLAPILVSLLLVGGAAPLALARSRGAEFLIPTANSGPEGITSGPGGSLWFTEVGGNNIGRVTTQGAFKEFPIPTPGSHPAGIAAGPDGNVWFTEFLTDKIGRVTPSG